MEGAGKLVEDEELREAMSEKGLGTPATRAPIIEGLIYEKYVHRQGRELQPTAKAFSLMALLRGLDIPELSSPELTGDWEFKLRQMARGQLQRAEFMKEIADMTREIVAKAKRHESDTMPGDFGTLKVPCPKCGGEIHENYKKFQCQKCDFALWKIVAGRQFEIPEIEELITKRQVGPLQGFRSKQGKPFAAVIKLTPELKPEFDFGNGPGRGRMGRLTEVDFTGKEPLGKCPKCGGRVFETAMNYVCEKAVGRGQDVRFPDGQDHPAAADRAGADAEAAGDGQDGPAGEVHLEEGPAVRGVPGGEGWRRGVRVRAARAEGRKAGAKTKQREEPEPKIDFTGQEPLGKCPMCGKRVFEGGTAYVCEQSQADKQACKFKIGQDDPAAAH